MSEQRCDEWCVLELMGHRRLGGKVSEQEIAGAAFLRIDVPGADGTTAATPFYSPAAVYAVTPTTEEMARAVALAHQPEPVTRWELRALEAPTGDVGCCVGCGQRVPLEAGGRCAECWAALREDDGTDS